MAKTYVGPTGFNKFMEIVKGAIFGKVDKDKIVADLTSTDDTGVLAASQGKALSDLITAKENGLQDQINALGGSEGLDKKLDKASVGVANGAASLGADGLVPSDQLPSYVDDVVEMKNTAAEGEDATWKVVDPETGSVTEEDVTFVRGKIFLDVDTNVSYRWGGTTLVKITSSDLVETTADEVQSMWDAITVPTTPEEEG